MCIFHRNDLFNHPPLHSLRLCEKTGCQVIGIDGMPDLAWLQL
jgi:hypothetical protein